MFNLQGVHFASLGFRQSCLLPGLAVFDLCIQLGPGCKHFSQHYPLCHFLSENLLLHAASKGANAIPSSKLTLLTRLQRQLPKQSADEKFGCQLSRQLPLFYLQRRKCVRHQRHPYQIPQTQQSSSEATHPPNLASAHQSGSIGPTAGARQSSVTS